MNNYRLYSHSGSEDFAQLIADKLDMPLYKSEIQHFADGEINVTINESVRGRDIIYIAQIEMPYTNFIEALQFCDAARRASANDIILVVPYLIHSRQERRDDKRSPITSRLFADLLQVAGAKKMISMDIHTGAIEGFYNIPFDKLYPTDVFVDKIKSLKISNLKLVAPDAGFTKKMKHYTKALGCGMAIIDKTRNVANQVDEMILIGDVKGNNVVIIDDMIDTANTTIKAADLVLANGAESVVVFATHGILSYKAEWDNAAHRLYRSKIKQVFVSNTMNTFSGGRKIEVLDITSIFAKAINKIITESVVPETEHVNV